MITSNVKMLSIVGLKIKLICIALSNDSFPVKIYAPYKPTRINIPARIMILIVFISVPKSA